MDEYVVESFFGTRADSFQSSTECCKSLRAGSQEIEHNLWQACHPASEQFLSKELLRHLATTYCHRSSWSQSVYWVGKTKSQSLISKASFPSWMVICSPPSRPSFRWLWLSLSATRAVKGLSVPCVHCILDLEAQWVRNRVSHLALMSIEKELLVGLDHGEVIGWFAQLKPRRYCLMIPPLKSWDRQVEQKVGRHDSDKEGWLIYLEQSLKVKEDLKSLLIVRPPSRPWDIQIEQQENRHDSDREGWHIYSEQNLRRRGDSMRNTDNTHKLWDC